MIWVCEINKTALTVRPSFGSQKTNIATVGRSNSCKWGPPPSRVDVVSFGHGGNKNLPETNSIFAPENGWLEDEFPLGMAYFQVLC